MSRPGEIRAGQGGGPDLVIRVNAGIEGRKADGPPEIGTKHAWKYQREFSCRGGRPRVADAARRG